MAENFTYKATSRLFSHDPSVDLELMSWKTIIKEYIHAACINFKTVKGRNYIVFIPETLFSSPNHNWYFALHTRGAKQMFQRLYNNVTTDE